MMCQEDLKLSAVEEASARASIDRARNLCTEGEESRSTTIKVRQKWEHQKNQKVNGNDDHNVERKASQRTPSPRKSIFQRASVNIPSLNVRRRQRAKRRRPSFSVQNDLTAYDDEELIEKFLTEELGINDELVS